MPFEAPPYVIKFEPEKYKHKCSLTNYAHGVWWIEIGSDDDIIAQQEVNRHKINGGFLRGWDYIKFPEAENMAIDWVQSLPGKRKS